VAPSSDVGLLSAGVSTAAVATARGPDVLEPAAELAARTQRFAVRLYHALLIARVAVPAAILSVLLPPSVEGDDPRYVAVVWGCLALWTAVTTPLVWSRLDWAQRLPWPVIVEMSALVFLLLVGLDTRIWHLLHSIVPLIFVAFFVGEVPARALAAAIVAALWFGHLVFLLGSAPLESPTPAGMATVIVVLATILASYGRRVFADTEAAVRAEQAAADAVADARHAQGAHLARLDLQALVGAELQKLAPGLVDDVRRLIPTLPERAAPDAGALLACVAAIDATLGQLSCSERAPQGRTTVRDEIEGAISQTEPLGKRVHVEVDPGDWVVDPAAAAPFRRLLTEALANARKHGAEPIILRVSWQENSVEVSVENGADHAVQPRHGGYGLASMEADAAALRATLGWSFDPGAGVRLAITVPAVRRVHVPTAEEGPARFRAALARRRLSYERAILVGRVGLAGLTAATIQIAADRHRSLLPALTATSVVLVTWNVFLLVRYRSVREALAARPMLVWIDGALIAVIVLVEGGMASPWMPLSMGSLMAMGLLVGLRGAVPLALLLSGAMLGGYELMRLLPLEDAGTRAQQMPGQWVWNTFIYLAVAAVGSGIGWIFARADESARAYEQTAHAQVEAEREAAIDEARAETGRELHASLQQYVGAALIRIDLIARLLSDPSPLRLVDERLTHMRDALLRILSDLRCADGPASDASNVPRPLVLG
jgi:signal transduction histidine kinase